MIKCLYAIYQRLCVVLLTIVVVVVTQTGVQNLHQSVPVPVNFFIRTREGRGD